MLSLDCDPGVIFFQHKNLHKPGISEELFCFLKKQTHFGLNRVLGWCPMKSPGMGPMVPKRCGRAHASVLLPVQKIKFTLFPRSQISNVWQPLKTTKMDLVTMYRYLYCYTVTNYILCCTYNNTNICLCTDQK